jgi:cobyrinic acid a,c-diamide synthase
MIKGVILNRIAGARHENIIRKSIEHHCGIIVIGSVPKLKTEDFPERHMGLVPTPEHEWAKASIEKAADVVEKYVDLEVLEGIAFTPNKKTVSSPNAEIKKQYLNEISEPISLNSDERPVIGIAKDSAFQFYYPDNIEALENLGAEVVLISPLSDKEIPSIDAMYIGGGFPETHAEKLAENKEFRESLKKLADDGLPVYAECGGLMYLGKELVVEEKIYPMTGILPIVFGISKKPQGHGYTIVEVDTENPYFDKGMELRGHEFRYSKVLKWEGNDSDLVFSTKRGTGFVNKRDGVCYKNVFASYTHLHALGTPSWAQSMVRNAILYKKRQIP